MQYEKSGKLGKIGRVVLINRQDFTSQKLVLIKIEYNIWHSAFNNKIKILLFS